MNSAYYPIEAIDSKYQNHFLVSTLMHGRAHVDDDEVIIVSYHDDEKWYIIPIRDDAKFLAVGPFDEPDDAFIYLRLLATYLEIQ